MSDESRKPYPDYDADLDSINISDEQWEKIKGLCEEMLEAAEEGHWEELVDIENQAFAQMVTLYDDKAEVSLSSDSEVNLKQKLQHNAQLYQRVLQAKQELKDKLRKQRENKLDSDYSFRM